MTLTKSVLAIRHSWQARGLPPLLPLLVVGLLVFCALLAPLLAPHSPIEGSLGKRLLPPLGMEGSSGEHVLGTDRLGRDTLSRLIYGAQISLAVSLVGILLTGIVGAAFFIIAGPRVVDDVVQPCGQGEGPAVDSRAAQLHDGSEHGRDVIEVVIIALTCRIVIHNFFKTAGRVYSQHMQQQVPGSFENGMIGPWHRGLRGKRE